MPRTYEEECGFINRLNDCKFEIKKGFVPNMNVEGRFYVNNRLEQLMFDELKFSSEGHGIGGFLPAVKQIANVASLPGIVGHSVIIKDLSLFYIAIASDWPS